MRNKKINLVIVVIYDESGIEGEKLLALDAAIREQVPDYHEFVGGNAFHIAFKNNAKNSQQADMFMHAIEELIHGDPRCHSLRVGRQSGYGVCQIDAWGRIRSIPIGLVAFQAMKSAVG